MRTITVNLRSHVLSALLRQASNENLVLQTPDGREFVLAEIDDFGREIALARENMELMKLLDECGRDEATWAGAEARRGLRV